MTEHFEHGRHTDATEPDAHLRYAVAKLVVALVHGRSGGVDTSGC